MNIKALLITAAIIVIGYFALSYFDNHNAIAPQTKSYNDERDGFSSNNDHSKSYTILGSILAIGILPSVISLVRRKKNRTAIVVLNLLAFVLLFLGVQISNEMGGSGVPIFLTISLVLWIVTLVWSLLYEKKQA